MASAAQSKEIASRLAPKARANEPASSAQAKETSVRFEIANLDFFYGPKQAVFGLNLSIPKNKVTALIGPSGCGKSTFLRTLNRMNEMFRNTRVAGQILLDGQDVLQMDVVKLRRRVGMVFQRPNPFTTTWRTVCASTAIRESLTIWWSTACAAPLSGRK
jgi:ABC-type phosphate transport system ATPase subunit